MAFGRNAQLAGVIAEANGLPSGSIDAIVDRGSVNHVFVVGSDTEKYVIRFPIDPLQDNDFDVEAWCLAQAADHGIPSPRVVANATLHGVPYLVQTFVDGAPPSSSGVTGWWTLGAYARIVHGIALTDQAPDGLFSRFGRDVQSAWRSHLDYNDVELGAADPLLKLGVYAPERQGQLRSVVARLGESQFDFGLTHGDLSLRNLLVPLDGPPVLIDWGSASVGPIPYGDLLGLVRMHRAGNVSGMNELAAFCDGYGLVLAELLPVMEDLIVLGHLDLVRWAIDNRPDRLGEIVATSRAGIDRLVR